MQRTPTAWEALVDLETVALRPGNAASTAAGTTMTEHDLSAINLLDVTPVRLADWEERGDRVVLLRPQPRAPWYLLPFEWVRYLLAVHRIQLDVTGSTAWRACDGTRTTGEIVPLVRQAVGAVAEPLEERLGQLVRRLRHEGLLAYRDLDRHHGLPGHAVERLLS
jgi:Coenzyme PQQ synthesis protein D (PqqD)